MPGRANELFLRWQPRTVQSCYSEWWQKWWGKRIPLHSQGSDSEIGNWWQKHAETSSLDLTVSIWFLWHGRPVIQPYTIWSLYIKVFWKVMPTSTLGHNCTNGVCLVSNFRHFFKQYFVRIKCTYFKFWLPAVSKLWEILFVSSNRASGLMWHNVGINAIAFLH